MIAPFVVVMILGSMLPSIDFDVLEYHLQGPKEYYQAGRIAFLPHNVYTSMPFGVEMLHLPAMEVMGDWWWGGLAGQLLVALFAPAAAVLIAATALARWLGTSRLVRGDRLPFDSVDLSSGGDRLRRRPALFLSRGPGLGRRPRLRGSLDLAALDLVFARPPGRLRDGLQVSGFDLGGDSVRSSLAARLQAESIGRARALLRPGLGGRDGPLAGQERDRHRQPGLSARQFRSSTAATGIKRRETKWSNAHGRKAVDGHRAGELAG